LPPADAIVIWRSSGAGDWLRDAIRSRSPCLLVSGESHDPHAGGEAAYVKGVKYKSRAPKCYLSAAGCGTEGADDRVRETGGARAVERT
jgi:hypothetical protein